MQHTSPYHATTPHHTMVNAANAVPTCHLLVLLQISGMLAPEEVDKALADTAAWAEAAGWPATREGQWNGLVSRVRDCLHLVLALSPVGEAFRARWGLVGVMGSGAMHACMCAWVLGMGMAGLCQGERMACMHAATACSVCMQRRACMHAAAACSACAAVECV
jgi:hypothetical protein